MDVKYMLLPHLLGTNARQHIHRRETWFPDNSPAVT
tara:strand:- start:900 stop:1007 length:108 start_codon:yes stop_codon:yes gene_type:complete